MSQTTDTTDFIATYNDALSAEQCKQWIKKFERSREKAPGMTGNGVNLPAKNSQDITISKAPDWQTENAEIEAVTYRHLVNYITILTYSRALSACLFPIHKPPANAHYARNSRHARRSHSA